MNLFDYEISLPANLVFRPSYIVVGEILMDSGEERRDQLMQGSIILLPSRHAPLEGAMGFSTQSVRWDSKSGMYRI